MKRTKRPAGSGIRQSPAREWSLKRIQSDSDLIKLIQRHRSPFWDRFFKIAATCGDEIAFTLGLPVISWTVPAPVFLLVILAWSITFYVGHSLKDYCQLPRPFVVDKDVVCLENHFSDEYGLPSTHAQAVWAIPTTLLSSLNLSHFYLWTGLALIYAVAVSFSRLYLGVHSLLDVMAGVLLGLSTCALVQTWGPQLVTFYMSLSPLTAVLSVFVLHILLLKLYPKVEGYSTTYRDTSSILGVSVGVYSGVFLLSHFYGQSMYQFSGAFSSWFLRVLFGLVLVVVGHECFKRLTKLFLTALYKLYNPQFSQELDLYMPFLVVYKFLAYTGIGFNSVFGVQLCFSAVNLY